MARRVLLAILFLVLVASSAPQQAATSPGSAPATQQNSQTDSEGSYQSSTVLKFTSRLVLVDVVATDHQGNPVPDLKREDFEVQEDGKKQELKVFGFQSPAQALSAPVEPPKPASNIFTNVPRFKPNKTLTVLLLDALNTRTIDQSSAKAEMLKFLEKLPADQPVAVYGLSAKLYLLQDFTTDPALLKNAVKALGGSKSSVVLEQPNGGTGTSEMMPGAIEITPPRMLQQMRLFQQESNAMQVDQRVRLTLAALNALGRSLAGYRGRKNLIWLSESFPLSVLPDSNMAGISVRSGANQRDYTTEFDKTASVLTDAQVAIYPVDVGSLMNSSVFSGLSNTDSEGNYLGRTATARAARGSGAQNRQAMNEEVGKTQEEQGDSHSTMNDLADRTGGKAFYNRNDVLSSINKSIDDGSTYYTLGYYPANKDWNGKFRKISLKVNRSGVKLRYRLGYFAADPEGYAKVDAQQRAADFGEALSLDFPVSTALLFQAQVQPPSDETKNKVLIRYAVDPHLINFDLQKDGLRHAAVECAVEVFSNKGEMVTAGGNASRAALTPAQFTNVMNNFFPCHIQFDLAPGQYLLRLGVRDATTGLMGTANATVQVAEGKNQ